MFIGLVLLCVGLAYLGWPQGVLRMNEFFRTTLFKDAHVLLNSRKIGSILILTSFLLMALGAQL
jgi:hypothetical protein